MLGFLIGAACLWGLVRVLRGPRWGHRGHGYFGRMGGFGPRAWLNRLFSRLDTSPSQEKAIVAAVEEARAVLAGLRGELGATRGDVARMLAEESFDAEKAGAVFARHDDALRRAREAVVGAFATVHATLDARQRATLAEIVESGPYARFRGPTGPYRSAVHI